MIGDDGGGALSWSRAEYNETLDLLDLTPEERRKAALTVCDVVQDATLARDLLAALGLNDL